MTQRKIAVGGSASNPPHLAHRALVQAVYDTGEFDEVHWLVSGQRYDKPDMIDPSHRFAMAQMTFAGLHDNIIVDREDEQTRPTVEVLRDYQKAYPDAEIVWYLGADHFAPKEEYGDVCDIVHFWDAGEILLREASFLIIQRNGYEIAPNCMPCKYDILSQSGIPFVSSSDARHNIHFGISNEGILHPDVINYIDDNQLYTP